MWAEDLWYWERGCLVEDYERGVEISRTSWLPFIFGEDCDGNYPSMEEPCIDYDGTPSLSCWEELDFDSLMTTPSAQEDWWLAQGEQERARVAASFDGPFESIGAERDCDYAWKALECEHGRFEHFWGPEDFCEEFDFSEDVF